MIVTRLTEVSPLVTLAEAKAWLRVDYDDEDETIEALIAAAQSHMDGPQNSFGCSVSTQTLRLDLPCFPSRVRLPYGPVQSISSVSCRDTSGAAQPVADYSAAGPFVSFGPSVHGLPLQPGRVDAVSITYVAGYEEGRVPPVFPIAIRMMVSEWFNQREAANGEARNEIPFGVERLLGRHRVIG